jgi:hypothetical protein
VTLISILVKKKDLLRMKKNYFIIVLITLLLLNLSFTIYYYNMVDKYESNKIQLEEAEEKLIKDKANLEELNKELIELQGRYIGLLTEQELEESTLTKIALREELKEKLREHESHRKELDSREEELNKREQELEHRETVVEKKQHLIGLAEERAKDKRPDLDKIIQEEFKKLSPGQILFNPADQMQVGVTERVEVRIAKGLTKDLAKGLRGRGDPEIEKIKVGTFMTARLTGSAFEIKSLNNEEQMVEDGGHTQWNWDVTPLKNGTHSLILTATVRIVIEGYGEQKKDCPVFEKKINVKVNRVYSAIKFLKTYWQWIITTLIGGGGLIALIRRATKKKSTPEKTNEEQSAEV